MAASPANVAWAAAFSAYAGATNATTEKLRAGGMGGSAAADYRERLRSSVQDALDAAIDADANTEQRRQALLKARTRCELEMGSEQAETNTTPPAPPST
ncbi:hypothetical protein [uncultured Thiodictyon sp.]|uniref:hypothetical protein n=1 Tax=uncultured Thiodictyon sp. TaxID=1846217 RepID=UPI0025E43033|nr:hypothetical protein [uncultured Thiodictyon sp.]